MKRTISNLLKIAEECGWSYQNEDINTILFSQYSPMGQDFNFVIDDIDERGKCADALVDNLERYIDNFDVSYETYLWLDTSGHGSNGAPYDMKDLYEDMEACRNMMQTLLDEWNKTE